MEDRRLFARLNVELPLRFLDPWGDREGNGKIMNISANGVSFITEEKIAPNSPIAIWVEMPDQRESLYIQGEVIWSHPLEAGNIQHRIGVRLDKEELIGVARALWIKVNHKSLPKT